MTTVEKLEEIIKVLEIAKTDATKVDEKGNVSAGVRLRKDAMSAAKALKELRDMVIDSRKTEGE
ncbi:MAG TPA: histone H1 [Patescibacteria group bacterium]|nr:histone H1 [Patescibacteria group bacterium]